MKHNRIGIVLCIMAFICFAAYQQNEAASQAAKNEINFSEMEDAQLKDVLQPVLDKALILCDYGNCDLFVDQTKPSVTLDTGIYFPATGLPYTSVSEMREDMRTVFTQEVLDTELAYILESAYADIDGVLYASSAGGYSKGRMWTTDQMEVDHVSSDTVTATMEVSFRDAHFSAPLTLHLVDGAILLGQDYFVSGQNHQASS